METKCYDKSSIQTALHIQISSYRGQCNAQNTSMKASQNDRNDSDYTLKIQTNKT